MSATSPRAPESRERKKTSNALRMLLIGADRDAFLDAVENPPDPTERLINALRRHQDLLDQGGARRHLARQGP
jgi:uncharacterized protein (DUF1778 family)